MRVYEGRDRKPHEPTPAELKQQSEREQWRKRYPDLYSSTSTAYRTWDYYPSGRLSFELWSGDRTRWSVEKVGNWHDRPTKRVEQYLNDAVVALVSAAALLKHKRAEAEEQARLRAEAAERRRREYEKQERAKKRREFLLQKASKHHEMQKLASFLHHLEGEVAKGGPGRVSRIAREMRSILEEAREQLAHDTLEAEINRRQLYTDDDNAG